MSLPTLNDDLDASAKQSQALLEQSTKSTQEVQTGLQPIRTAIDLAQQVRTAEFTPSNRSNPTTDNTTTNRRTNNDN